MPRPRQTQQYDTKKKKQCFKSILNTFQHAFGLINTIGFSKKRKFSNYTCHCDNWFQHRSLNIRCNHFHQIPLMCASKTKETFVMNAFRAQHWLKDKKNNRWCLRFDLFHGKYFCFSVVHDEMEKLTFKWPFVWFHMVVYWNY